MGVWLNKADTVQELVMMTNQLVNTKRNVEKLVSRFEEYLADEENSSEAISSHKTYIQTAQLPVAKGIIEICDRKAEANGKYIERLHSLFPSDDEIDQDYWVEMHNSLSQQFDEINNLHTMAIQFVKSLFSRGYKVQTEYGKDYQTGNTDTSPYKMPEELDNTIVVAQCMITSYAHELEVLSSAMAYYYAKILRVDSLLSDLTGLYYQTDILNEALAKAIQQLGNIGVTRNGNYYYNNVDCSAFENLEDTICSLNAGDLIIEELGDEYIPPARINEITDDERMKYLEKVNEIAKAIVPSMSFKRGHEEIPICLGITVYYENTVTLKTDSDFPISNSITEKNNKYLSSSSLKLGDCSGNVSESSTTTKISEKIGPNTTIYLSVGFDDSTGVAKVENGVVTTIGEVKNDTHAYYVEKATVTTACGVKYEPGSVGWTPDNCASTLSGVDALPIVSVSDWELATQLIGIPVGLPGGVLAPAY